MTNPSSSPQALSPIPGEKSPWFHFPERAVVIFKPDTEIWWLRWLRPGFRHCLVALEDARGWTILDPLSHQMQVHRLEYPQGFDLAGFLRGRGILALDAPLRQAPPQVAPWAPFTCTEAVKRILGIHNRWIWTPYQLFLFLGSYPLKREQRVIIYKGQDGKAAKNRQNRPAKRKIFFKGWLGRAVLRRKRWNVC